MTDNAELQIDMALVQRLIDEQFPDWSALNVAPVAVDGWSNRTFHLGDEMSVRLPSGAEYAGAVAIEQKWLPRLGAKLPLSIPQPIAHGQPNSHYPWPWSIYKWLPGAVATKERVVDQNAFAKDLADFLLALQSIDTEGGPVRELRGGSLSRYEKQTEAAMRALARTINIDAARDIWDAALGAPIEEPAVWFHGDVAAGNLLVVEGRLSSVIDFGGVGVGDPACDLVIAWTFLEPESRAVFRERLGVNDALWNRGRGWALWKAMIVVAGIVQTNAIETEASGYALAQLFVDYEANR